MTSIYQYNRNGVPNNANMTSSSNNKVSGSIRGRTESPGLRSRYQRLTTTSNNDNQDMMPPNRSTRNTPVRNPPERISANPIETQRQYANKVNSMANNYLNKTGEKINNKIV